jgi:hypothetical protein
MAPGVLQQRRLLIRALAAVAAVALVAGPSRVDPARAAAPKFYDDDPLARVPETQDASGAAEYDIDLATSLLVNLFVPLGDPRTNVRAGNLNTADEVPDSSWFTNRVYARPITAAEIARGANTIDGPAPGKWTVIAAKTSGAAPGFRMRDARGELWFVSLDARVAPGAATGAIAVASRLFWALGYNQVENYLTAFRLDDLEIAATAEIEVRPRYERRLQRKDLEAVLARGARSPDGSYRAIAARALPGRVLGGFPYYGTRPDDPNDIVPHEHRRELRALKVFGAWTNLVDLKALNTLDTVITENGRGLVRHYLQDVGSTFGTGANAPHTHDQGHEFLYEGEPLWKRLVTFGFYLRPWQTVPYHEHPEIGRIETVRGFDPERWRPRAPVAPLRHARADDTFWAALRVAAFTDDMIRAAVREGRYTDPAAAELLTAILIERRDAIARVYLPKITPLVKFTLDAAGVLTFENAAVRAGVATPPAGGYRAIWSSFDNTTHAAAPIGETTSSADERLTSPPAVRDWPAGRYLKAAVSAVDAARPSWARPVDVYFRRTAGGWQLVGLDRRLDAP